MEFNHPRWNMIAGAIVLVVILSGYLVTISPTVSFWDSGEFIATSYILGVPHPPGTPFYVIVGRVFAMLPFGERALGVNLMSALTGALASLFLYLITVRILVHWRGVPGSARQGLIIYCSAASAALAGAFSGSFWVNSIEAEVYSPAALIMAFTVWLMVRWAQRHREEGSRNSLVLICYLLGLSVGLHLGTVLVLPAFVMFALVVDYKLFTDVKFIVLVAFVGLLGLSNHLFLPIRSALNPAIDEANPERWDAFRDCLLRKQYKPMTPFIRQAPWDFQFGMFWRYFREQWTGAGGIWTIFLTLPVAAMCVVHFLKRRRSAVLGVGIFLAVLSVLALLRYALGDSIRPQPSWTILLMLAGGAGGLIHCFKHRKTFVLMATLVLITTLGLIVYMNFTDHEVRERDYFYSHGFFFFCVWIGVAFAYLADFAEDPRLPRWATPAVLAALLAFTFSAYAVNFESHNRRGDYNAHDYGYNMLATVAPNGLIFTNGDNDTFPLWFIQEVKGFRKDVRVVNLSLLNTSWYIWQLKHLAPEVPFGMSDREIAGLEPYRDKDGRIVMVKDVASDEIIKSSEGKKPVYFAVTVADFMGYDPNLVLEGLAFRYQSQKATESIDEQKTLHNLYSVYRYRGLLTPAAGGPAPAPQFGDVAPAGMPDAVDLDTKYVYDTAVHKDLNTKRLVTNYTAAHLKLCIYYLQNSRFDQAKRELERAMLISPGFEGYKEIAIATFGFSGEIARAESLAYSFIAKDPKNVNLYAQLFRVYRRANMLAESEEVLQRLVSALPGDPEGYSLLASFYEEQGTPAKAADVVRQWIKLHPNDRSAINLLQTLESKARGE